MVNRKPLILTISCGKLILIAKMWTSEPKTANLHPLLWPPDQQACQQSRRQQANIDITLPCSPHCSSVFYSREAGSLKHKSHWTLGLSMGLVIEIFISASSGTQLAILKLFVLILARNYSQTHMRLCPVWRCVCSLGGAAQSRL